MENTVIENEAEKGAPEGFSGPDRSGGTARPLAAAAPSDKLARPLAAAAPSDAFLQAGTSSGDGGKLARPLAAAAPRECPQMGKILGRLCAPRSLRLQAALAGLLCIGAPSRAATTLEGLNVYPNPARQYAGQTEVVFDNLTADAEIRIYDAEGALVREMAGAAGFLRRWDMKDDAGARVASGVYIYVVRSPAGENKVGKVAVIR
jgi:hypothetical protein